MSDREVMQLVGGPYDGDLVNVYRGTPVFRSAVPMVRRDYEYKSIGGFSESVMNHSRVVDYTRRVWVEVNKGLSSRIEFFGLSTMTDAECLVHLLRRPPLRPAAPPDRTT